MRLWSIHPKHLDAKGLVALWREALLAQKVLRGKTKGYKHHPQLLRFKEKRNPVAAIGKYLEEIFLEAVRRGYNFDRSKIVENGFKGKIPVNSGQIRFEWEHFREKAKLRDKNAFDAVEKIKRPLVHPIFESKKGPKEIWERG